MKKKYLAVAGFVIGTGAILIASPPAFLTAPEDFIQPVVPETPIASPTPEVLPTSEASKSPAASVSPAPVVSKTPTAPVVPKPVVSAPPTVAPTTSQTISGDVFAAGKYGNVQVQIVVKSGVITSAKALIFPSADSRSSSISATAIPVLIEQTLTTQSSDGIDGASGASYTSAAWISSLQSALAKA
jgi:uncharacterized protein with FMN-binding domain